MTQLVEAGNTVQVHYVGTLEDGSEFDNSRERGEALTFEVGGSSIIAGFSDAVVGMTPGETKTVTIPPENAYGSVMEEAVQNVPRDAFPSDFEFVKGAFVKGLNPNGQEVLAKIVEYTEDSISIDMNHPLAGKNLQFEIELVDIV